MKTWLKPTIVLAILFMMSLGTPGSVHSAPVTPALFVPGDLAVGPTVNTQTDPAISSGSGAVLAVWVDNRSNTTGGYEAETSWDIYGMRLDTAGNPIDALPLPIATGPASQEKPQAAWNGTNWLVVYESYELHGTGYYYQKSLEAVRVSPGGQVLDPKPIKIYGMVPSGANWVVASDMDQWVVVNQGTPTQNGMVAVRISSGGVLLDPPVHTVVEATYYQRYNLKLAYAGGVFLLTYNDKYLNGTHDTKAVRFDGQLNLLDPEPVWLLDAPLYSLASNGSQFYAVWGQQLPNFTVPLFGSRVNTLAQKLDGAGVNISLANLPQAYTTSSVTWDGINWRASWGFNNTVRVARINASGQVLDPGGVAVPGPQTGLSAGTGTGGIQLIWSPYPNSSLEIETGHISAGNIAGANRILSIGAPMQLNPDTATSGAGYMMVYISMNASGSRILAQPLDAAGGPLSAEPVELAAGASLGAPAVAWNGSVYLVAWSNASGVAAQRLQANGTKVDPTPVSVMTPAFGPVDVEAMGANFLVVARKFGYTPEWINTIAARVDGTDGSVLDPSVIVLGYIYASSPRVVVLGGRWLVAWQDNSSHDNPMASTLGAFVDAGGVKTASFSIHGPYSTAGGNGSFSIGLASNGNVALMVQSQELTSGVENDLLIRLVNPDGTAQPYKNITPWEGNQLRPRAAWDGTQFIVVFQDQKNRFTYHSLEQLDARTDLFGMRISPSGTVLDPQGFVFSNSLVGEATPNLIAGNGTTLIAASLMRNEAPYVNYRVGYRLYGGGNQWPVAVASANTASGAVPFTVGFSAAGSTDPDGSIASYLWDFGDGSTSTQANPSHLYTASGNYVVMLTVTDNEGAQTVETAAIRASLPNQIPIADASASPMTGPKPLDVIFYADASYDPDGFIGNIEWTFPGGSSYWGSPAYHTFENNGTFPVILTVYDSNGATGTDTIMIQVGGVPPTPTPVPGGSAMHVGGIAISVIPAGNNRFAAQALVTILDAGGLPVSGATVSGVFTGDSSGAPSAVTNASGQATLTSPAKKNGANWTFCVSTVTKTGAAYDPAANAETCDSTGGPPTPTATPSPTATPGAGTSAHIADLDGVSTLLSRGWKATLTITVHDQAHNPVAGAVVTGAWSGGTTGSATCTTAANGQCTLIKSGISAGASSVTFSVTGITLSGTTYQAAANHDPDGDSTGTVIVIAKP